MKPDRQLLASAVLPGSALAAWLMTGGALLWATFPANERTALAGAFESRFALVLMLWLFTSMVLGLGAMRWYRLHVQATRRLAELSRALLDTGARHAVTAHGGGHLADLSEVINSLVIQRGALQDGMAQQVRVASERIERERRRLATLMAELEQSVVVCNLDGRILLYNQRARLQFSGFAGPAGQLAQAGAIGLGRSIHDLLDRRLVDHALDDIRLRLARGAASASTQFVTTTAGGQLMRVHLAPVVESNDAHGVALPEPVVGGLVLMLENATREFEQESLRDQLLHSMTEGSRGSLASLQAAVEMLDYADADSALRAKLLAVVREEAAAMAKRVEKLAKDAARGLTTRWPMQDMLASDLLAASARRIEADGSVQIAVEVREEDLWLRVDSFSLMQALTYLALRLEQEFGVRRQTLRVAVAGERAHLDLVWSGVAMNTETVMGWELDPIRVEGQTTPLTVRDVVERHGGAFWFERERARHEMCLRFLLPQAGAQALPAPGQSAAIAERVPTYDFDLFHVTDQTRALEERRLDSLSYTVFDTETTGLDPTGGDAIIQLGATRIVNGRLLQQEGFEQLVHAERTISVASQAVHGITNAMLQGQPRIDLVLQGFYRFAHDTVLVAHNAAFDMRFLQLQETSSGVRFDHPVLDTLLLSSWLHPHQESHTLESMATRFGLVGKNRHSALGDAVLTAEVFLKLLPLLADRGIHTLGQARAAALGSWHARVRY